MLKKVAQPLLLATLAVLFLIANRGAYEGYFQDDDLDTMAWTRYSHPMDYVKAFFSPKLSTSNFRPVGHAMYKLVFPFGGIERFGPYVAAIQALHLTTAVLLWLLLRRLEFPAMAALPAWVFFLFHPATLPAYWQPMYFFDVTCGLFSVACVLLWTMRRWVLSLVCMWAAFKAKELAIMLPIVLLAYEWLIGDRRWKPLLPFFGVSALFGVQSLLYRQPEGHPYRLIFTIPALRQTIPFYVGALVRNTHAAAFLAAFIPQVRDRRFYFALAAALAMSIPLLFLPGRMFAVYSYAPLALLSIAVAAVAARSTKAQAIAVTAVLLVWIPLTFSAMKEYRKWALTVSYDHKAYVAGVREYVGRRPDVTTFVIDTRPEFMHAWGAVGAVHHFRDGDGVRVLNAGSTEAEEALKTGPSALLRWDPVLRRLQIDER